MTCSNDKILGKKGAKELQTYLKQPEALKMQKMVNDSFTDNTQPKTKPKTQGIIYYIEEWENKLGLPRQAIYDYDTLGDEQRGEPEKAMNKAAKYNGGVMAFVLEHVGDLTNRMSPRHGFGFSLGSGQEKTKKTLRSLTHPYGFRNEWWDNVESNSRYSNINRSEFLDKDTQLRQAYADAHRKLEVHTPLHYYAREAAIAVAELRITDAIKHLEQVQELIKNEASYIKALKDYHRTPIGDK